MRRVASVSVIMCLAVAALAPAQADADLVTGPVARTQTGEVGGIVDGAVVEWRAVPYDRAARGRPAMAAPGSSRCLDRDPPRH